jgi:hypothetical protein
MAQYWSNVAIGMAGPPSHAGCAPARCCSASARIALGAGETFPSREYRGLEEIIQEFLGRRRDPLAAAAFGIAGAVLSVEVSSLEQ